MIALSQGTLKHLHLNCELHPANRQIWGAFQHLKTLDVSFSDDVAFLDFIVILFSNHEHLETLAITIQRPLSALRYLDYHTQTAKRKLALRNLSLKYVPLRTLFAPLNCIIDFSQLDSLTLWACHGTELFLPSLTHAYQGVSLPLRHLSFALHQADRGTLATPGFMLLLNACQHVETLHIESAEQDSRAPDTILFNKLCEAGDLLNGSDTLALSLRTLSLYQADVARFSSTMAEPTLYRICCQYPEMQQLGWQIPELCILDTPGDFPMELVCRLIVREEAANTL